MSKLFYTISTTRFGWVGIVGIEGKLKEIILPCRSKKEVSELLKKRYPEAKFSRTKLTKIVKALQLYFCGVRNKLSFPVDLSGYSTFEKKVYQATKTVPYGEVRTYGWLAWKIGRPKAVRAVGNALAKNPVPLVIPCHRIIRSNGTIGKFSRAGPPELKSKLIELETRSK